MSLYEWWSDAFVASERDEWFVCQYRRIRSRPSLVLHTPGHGQRAVASFASKEDALAFCAALGLEVREDNP